MIPRRSHTCLRVVLVLVLLFVSAWASDPVELCTFEADTLYPWQEGLQCLQSIPLEDSVRLQTLDALIKASELYAFTDIATMSPDPRLPVEVDLPKELSQLASATFAYDWLFHESLMMLFKRLFDAHAEYYPPKCYQVLTVRQPLSPISFVDPDGEQVVVVSPDFDSDLVSFFLKTAHVDLTSLSGCEIQEVDGIHALSYFQAYANTSIGVSKDAGTRLNLAFASPQPRTDIRVVRPSHWQTVNLKYNPFPTSSNVSYKLSCNGEEKNYTFPWLLSSDVTFASRAAFLDSYRPPSRLPRPQTSILGGINDELNRPLENDLLGGRRRSRVSCPPSSSHSCSSVFVGPRSASASSARSGPPEPPSSLTLLANSTDLTVWSLGDGETAVLYIATMGSRCPLETFRALVQGFEEIERLGLTRLIIDLTNNPGGRICFGRSLLAYLQPAGQKNWGPQDLPLSPLQHLLTSEAVRQGYDRTVWSPGYYNDQNDERVSNNDTSLFDPGYPHVRGAGRRRSYSGLVHYSGVWVHQCGDIGYWLPEPIKVPPKDILIVTHGYCGSTCAYFSNHMALYDNVRTVVVGGRAGYPQQYSSYPGIQVLDSELIYWMFHQLHLNITQDLTPHDPVPRLLPTSASYRYCIREIYPPEPRSYDAQPTEFVFQQATFHMNNTYGSAVYPSEIWFAAAHLLG